MSFSLAQAPFIFLLLLCLSCTSNNTTNTVEVPAYQDTTVLKDPAITTFPSQIIAFKAFSSHEQKDTFKLEVLGAYLLGADLRFTITSSNGELIYEENFPYAALIGYEFMGEPDDTIAQLNYLSEKIQNFFDDQQFNEPAISDHMGFDSDYSDKAIWEELKDNTTAIGFSYTLFEEDIRKIAYSPKHGKVLMYYNCC